MSKSTYLSNKLLDHVLRNVAFSQPSTIYVGLYLSMPTDVGGGTEVSGGSYVRQVGTFAVATNGKTSNSADIVFPAATANWGTVVGFGLFDSLTGGNMLYYGDVTPNKQVNELDTAKYLAGELEVEED